MNEPLDDEDNFVRDRRPLELGLVRAGGMDGENADDDGGDGQESAQDATGDGDGAEDNEDDTEPPQDVQDRGKQACNIAMADRDAYGQWRTIGESQPDAQFADLALAFETVDRPDRRDFLKGFDWLANPRKAWIAVRAGQVEALRVSRAPPSC